MLSGSTPSFFLLPFPKGLDVLVQLDPALFQSLWGVVFSFPGGPLLPFLQELFFTSGLCSILGKPSESREASLAFLLRHFPFSKGSSSFITTSEKSVSSCWYWWLVSLAVQSLCCSLSLATFLRWASKTVTLSALMLHQVAPFHFVLFNDTSCANKFMRLVLKTWGASSQVGATSVMSWSKALQSSRPFGLTAPDLLTVS